MKTLNSKAVAEMLGKRHDNFLRDIRKYISTLGEAAPEYFTESSYKDGLGKVRFGYEISLKGCELIAGRIIGSKSDEFREKYREIFKDSLQSGSEAVQGGGYSTEDVAQRLGCSRRTVQRMIQRGDLKTTQVTIMVPTVKTVITADELERYLNGRAEV